MRRAFITGWSSKLGVAAADRLRAEGIEVVTADLTGPADVLLDVTDAGAVQQAAAEAGDINILVDSAGMGHGDDQLTPDVLSG